MVKAISSNDVVQMIQICNLRSFNSPLNFPRSLFFLSYQCHVDASRVAIRVRIENEEMCLRRAIDPTTNPVEKCTAGIGQGDCPRTSQNPKIGRHYYRKAIQFAYSSIIESDL